MFNSFLLLIRSLVWIGAGLLLVLFALNNRSTITVSLEPIYPAIAMPMWGLLFVGIFIGLLITAVVTGILRLKAFVRRRQAERTAADLSKQVAAIAEDAHLVRAERAHNAARETAALAKNGD
ncbi:hypothetical protein [Kordiimonas pumila]|uniref:Lipopolysaccharide assembly protein A domain-containing protein n=1 Tax=Kordiimonas pumila TaxID=2161677 RepID=A0ABV7D641_9PROT|nr:hypothetical protein [Kordiimonas pumila]